MPVEGAVENVVTLYTVKYLAKLAVTVEQQQGDVRHIVTPIYSRIHEINATKLSLRTQGPFSFAAMIMCFSPTLIKLPSTSDYFLFWGLVVIVSAVLLRLRQPAAARQ